jgi:hypothetical protein
MPGLGDANLVETARKIAFANASVARQKLAGAAASTCRFNSGASLTTHLWDPEETCND